MDMMSRIQKAHAPGRLILFGLALTVSFVAPASADEYERIREKAEEMAVSVNETVFSAWGEGDDADLERAYNDFGFLLTPSKLEKLDELIGEVSDAPDRVAERERTANLIRYHALRSRVAPVLDNCINAQRDNSVLVEGTSIVLRGLDHRTGLESDRDMRRKWWLAAGKIYSGINVYKRSLLMDLSDHAKLLGYDGFYPFLREIEGWDIDLIQQTAESILSSSKDSFETELTALAQSELGLELRKIRSYDADYMFFFPTLSDRVGKTKPLDVARSAFKEFGLDLKKQRTLKVDARDRDGRDPWARAFPIRNGKVEVTMVPSERITDVQDLMGALGEAEFYYLIPGDLRFEDSYFGPNIIPSAYHALFELMVEEPAWVAKHIEPKDASATEVADAFRLRRLRTIRQAAGDFLFQLQLHTDPRVAPETYNTVMEEALLWKRTGNDADAYLEANDDFRSGGELLGYVVAAQIRAALREQWGENWFENKELAKKLEQGAARGYRQSLDEFLAIWGVTGFDAGVLSAELVSN